MRQSIVILSSICALAALVSGCSGKTVVQQDQYATGRCRKRSMGSSQLGCPAPGLTVDECFLHGRGSIAGSTGPRRPLMGVCAGPCLTTLEPLISAADQRLESG